MVAYVIRYVEQGVREIGMLDDAVLFRDLLLLS